jgi:hypothetical protein
MTRDADRGETGKRAGGGKVLWHPLCLMQSPVNRFARFWTVEVEECAN